MIRPAPWQSVRLRLLVWMVVSLVVAALLAVWAENQADMRALQHQAQDRARLVASLVNHHLEEDDRLSTENQALRQLAGQHEISQAMLVQDGQIANSTLGTLQGRPVSALQGTLWLPNPPLDLHSPGAFFGKDQALFVQPLAQDGKTLLLWVDTLPPMPARLANLGRLALMALVTALLAGGFFYWVLNRALVKPIEHISLVLRQHMRGERSARVGPTDKSELGQLGGWLDLVLDDEERALRSLQESHEKLEEQTALFQRVFKIMPDLVSITRLDDGVLVNVNENWVKRIGWSKEEVLGRTTLELGVWSNPSDRQQLVGQVKDNLLRNVRLCFQDRWGETVEAEASGCVFEENDVPYLLLSFRDIGERLRKEKDLRLLAQVVEVSLDGVMITDASQHILTVNSAFTTITGFAPEDVIGQTPKVLSSGYQDASFYKTMWQQIAAQGFWKGEIWNKRKSGEVYPQWLSIRAMEDDYGQVQHYVAVFSDISEHKAAEARIAFLAYHDPLTGLPNRTLLVDRAEQALIQAKRGGDRLAIIYLDLDRFKSVNDSLGHDIGDTLLKEVVKRIKPLCREGDTLSRQGGDEFLLLIPKLVAANQVELIVERILAAMSEPFVIGGHRLWISTSIGVSLYPEDGDNVAQLLRQADTALYHAKDSGRSTYSFFNKDMDRDLNERLQLESALKDAIGTPQLTLHYQPQFDVASGDIVGVEALMRWHSPVLGDVSPSKFIPLAEDTGLIMPLGAWCLEEACRQLAQWRKAGFQGLMAVNISVRQLVRPDFFDLLESVLAGTDIPAHRLELELTESLMMDNVDASLEVVRRLKALQLTLSIDDFGTGYSSLSYLKQFSVDSLKIDQSFIRGLSDAQQSRPLVRAIVQMAHSLELRVIAEGVETSEQLAILRQEGVDVAQGYFLGRPEPAKVISGLLAEQAMSLPAAQKG
ncbi:EAL domain-containing protein [Gallaecimonas xiamenensis]|nr:EAL domain-containing protein [Gallaecimonas xiamenensis]